MIYLAIDIRDSKAKKFLDFIKSLSLPFIKEIELPNDTTIKAITDARQRKTIKAKNTKELFTKLDA
ncbi:MAG: hypothetical protein A2275_04565 [Bacteroidetes bacterium RIFOXYA12_FULL_35_11]|nr:MAG: hypothetical protein A2X01_13810 [Bacteroidetes bacterium GWF2_35_48]OFY75617.1 MAG: hypothetical protein A2275_04565 [Bacteroidetes bacterium RIFOXYA12_FULL_35_11]OFY94927.1 MAG: hypothetical protein A2491_12015 [Bacteroidetes bacterium RIFOXYC12_FULL_35_7]OFY95619.1 MAG: hypothetical protein A2309_00755 [Bacteroidetes bacterium RIFOXYB2_FULL_35_7]HBX52077.1 hypothetical protein [Bacteroidales bacterium]